LTSDWYDGASTIFLKAENSGNESFTVRRVINSPYLWEAYRVTTTSSDEASSEDTTEMTNGSTWGLRILTEKNPNYVAEIEEYDSKDDLKNYALTPEVVAGEALQGSAIEQTRTLARNVSARVMPNTHQAGDPLKRAWAYVEGTKSNIKKPIDVDGKIYGVDAGFDLQRDLNNAFGVFVSYRNGDYDVDGSKSKGIGSSIDIDSYLGGLYYRYNLGKFKGLALVYAGRQKADVKTDDRIASFDTKGLEFGAAGEIGYEFDLNRVWSLDPSVGLRYTQIDFDSASDNVGKKYDWDDVKYLEAEASLALTRHFTQGKLYVKPAVLQTLTSGDSVKITGLDSTSTTKDMTLGRIEIGGRYDLTERLSGYGWAHYTAGSDYDATAAGLGLSYHW
jgi:outer membrane autotransporter protein